MTTSLPAHGDGDGSRRGIHGLGEPVHSALLPILQILLMLSFEIGVLHDDDCGGRERQAIVGGLASHQNAVADLKILQLDGRGVLQDPSRPGAMRRMRVVGCTVTLTSGPESGVSVICVPLIALMAPMGRLPYRGAAACLVCTLADMAWRKAIGEC